MSRHLAIMIHRLHQGVATAMELAVLARVSQPTVSRALSGLGEQVIRLGATRSSRYALRDTSRGLPDIPIHRVDAQGRVTDLGVLVPVRPEGFVMLAADGQRLHSEGLPWWLQDMRPQGFLGRAFAAQHAASLGLSPHVHEWGDTQALKALLAHGSQAVGNLLVGDAARHVFIHDAPPTVLDAAEIGPAYSTAASLAEEGHWPGSSAAGEQPKFTAVIDRGGGPVSVLVKCTSKARNPVAQRWRDLLLTEHHALETLQRHGLSASTTRIVDHGGRRFLEVERFDRCGERGRRGILSLESLEAEFIGRATEPWPVLVRELVQLGYVLPAAAETSAVLYAFGRLIGNTDMHHGNLSFTTESGRPYALAPAYDMLCMGFAPRSGGSLPQALHPLILHDRVPAAAWRVALEMARDFRDVLQKERRFSPGFKGCREALDRHLVQADRLISRLG